ncbi:ABC transporter substrate-binding protein [Leucobacter sp. wl10]|uniref:ABC transporter substrate-binding protein n=1 Tax=Leucobacter sp. wl10 TaxID=2304677 RepID=UPI000E5BD975|nr:ABC transporter substrate-binding protein [Leucobacter sp. wl10]RGE19139.1 peptide ABC transporter [Leucobacter sp. wl10]
MSLSRPQRLKSWLSVLSLVVVASLALTGCSGSSPADSGSGGSAKQVLTFGLSADPAQPITGASQGTAVNQLLTMVHRGLTSFDASGQAVPALAKSIETPDDTTYVFTLYDGLTFSDGSELNADNVKNTLEYYRDPANGSQLAAFLADIESIESDGASQVTVKLSQPNNAFLQYLALPYAGIVPDASLNPDTANWVGAGPWKMTNLDQGIGLTMKKNENYYDAENIALDQIDVKFYADGEARTNALLSGDVDLIDYVTWENFDRVANAGFTVDQVNGPFQYVQFNVEDGPFADPKVRQAVAYALNRDNSVLAAFQSNGKPLNGLAIPESDPAYNENLANLWSYDPEKAKSLLAEAGYADGFSARLLSTSQYTFLQDNALSVQEDLKAIGIDVTLDAPDWSTRVSQGNEGDYDIAVSGDSGAVADPSYLLNWVTDDRTYNVSWGYKNDEIADLIGQGLQATDDTAKQGIYQQIGKLWAEDVPFASLNTRAQAYGYSDSVKGFSNLPGTLTFYSGYMLANTSMQ